MNLCLVGEGSRRVGLDPGGVFAESFGGVQGLGFRVQGVGFAMWKYPRIR